MPEKKISRKRKTRKSAAAPKNAPERDAAVIQPGSGRRFLLGCCFPVLLFLLLLCAAAVPFLWSILSARTPQYIPPKVNESIHFLRCYSSLLYQLTEKTYTLAGGMIDPLERAKDGPFSRVEIEDDSGVITAWRILPYTADRSGGGKQPETVTFMDREAFLRSLRRDGEYRDLLRFPCLTQYQNGRAVRIRKCAAKTGAWLFDCRYATEKNGQDRPWCGRHFREDKGNGMEYTEIYLAGKKIQERIFISACYLRDEDGLQGIKPENRMFYRYAFSGDNERLKAAVRSKNRGSLQELIRQKKMIFGPGAVSLFPDSLIRMAVWNSDLDMLNILLREEAAIAELTDENSRSDFTTLHAAAMQPDPRILAKILPLYSEVNQKEHVTGATPFLTAVMMGNTENVLLFLRRMDKRPNDTLNDGSTALHLAASAMHPNITEILLNYGADKTLRNKSGETPLSLLKKKMAKDGWENHPDALRMQMLLQ